MPEAQPSPSPWPSASVASCPCFLVHSPRLPRRSAPGHPTRTLRCAAGLHPMGPAVRSPLTSSCAAPRAQETTPSYFHPRDCGRPTSLFPASNCGVRPRFLRCLKSQSSLHFSLICNGVSGTQSSQAPGPSADAFPRGDRCLDKKEDIRWSKQTVRLVGPSREASTWSGGSGWVRRLKSLHRLLLSSSRSRATGRSPDPGRWLGSG